MTSIDPRLRNRWLAELADMRAFLESLPATRSCLTCEFWKDGCGLYDAMPPDDVKAVGCEAWLAAGDIPF